MPNPIAVAAGGSVLGGILGNRASERAADSAANASIAGVNENKRQFDTVLGLQAPAINTGNAARSLLASILGLDVPGSSFTAGGNGVAPGAPGGNGVPTPTTPDRAQSHSRRILHVPLPTPASTASQTTPTGTTFTSPASSALNPDEIMARLEALPGYKFAVDQATKSAGALGSATGSLGGNVTSALADRVSQGIAMPTFENYLNRLAGLSGGAQTASNSASDAAITTGGLVGRGLENAGDSRASGILGQAGTQIGTLQGILGALGSANGGGGRSPHDTWNWLDIGI